MVESSLLRMRKPCFFVSSSRGGSVSAFCSSFFSSSLSSSSCSFSFSPSSPSSPVSVSPPSSDSSVLAAYQKEPVNHDTAGGTRRRSTGENLTFLSSLASLEITVHMSWQPGNSKVVTTCGLMLL